MPLNIKLILSSLEAIAIAVLAVLHIYGTR